LERAGKENIMAKFDATSLVEVDDDDVKRYVQENYDPEEVYPVEELERWAERNGFAKEAD
jgi:hypothetical protein